MRRSCHTERLLPADFNDQHFNLAVPLFLSCRCVHGYTVRILSSLFIIGRGRGQCTNYLTWHRYLLICHTSVCGRRYGGNALSVIVEKPEYQWAAYTGQTEVVSLTPFFNHHSSNFDHHSLITNDKTCWNCHTRCTLVAFQLMSKHPGSHHSYHSGKNPE